MDELTFMILKVVISVATALITAYLIPYIKNQTKTKQQEELMAMVNIAVRAAEQSISKGQKKKENATEFVTQWLNERGIKITEDQLDGLIEAAVYSMNNEPNTVVAVEKPATDSSSK